MPMKLSITTIPKPLLMEEPQNVSIEKVMIGHLNLNELALTINQLNREKGFYEEPEELRALVKEYGNPKIVTYMEKLLFSNRISLMHSELSEGLEGDRKDLMDDHLPHLPSREVELADALIRILDAAGAYKIDIARAVEEKLNYNRTRPYKHGKTY